MEMVNFGLALRRLAQSAACSVLLVLPLMGPVQAELRAQENHDSMVAKATMALMTSDFGQLESWFESYRTTRSRTPNGAWGLTELYSAVANSHHFPDGAVGLKLWKEFTSQWEKSHPISPTPHILLARQHYREAWRIRGGGFADAVWDDDWKRFEAELKNAREILIATKATSARDPEWYAMMIAIGLELGDRSAKLNALFKEAIRDEPLYLPTLAAIMRAHSPLWGRDARQAAKIARAHSDRIGGSDGDMIYSFMFRMAIGRVASIDELRAVGFDWTRVERGLLESLARSPSRSAAEFEEFMSLACSGDSPKLLQATADTFAEQTKQPREIMDFDYYCRKGKHAEPKPVIPPAPLLQDAAASKARPVPRE